MLKRTLTIIAIILSSFPFKAHSVVYLYDSGGSVYHDISTDTNHNQIFINITNGTTVTFAPDLYFKNNTSTGTNASIILANHTTPSNLYFGNNILFENNKLYNNSKSAIFGRSTYTFNGDVSFINNYSDGVTATIYLESSASKATFHGTTIFKGNSANSVFNSFHRSGAFYAYQGDFIFSPLNKGQYILIENNLAEGKLNTIYIHYEGTTLDFNLIDGTYANVRDPITSTDTPPANIAVNISKGHNGTAGKLYLWGDNNEYYAQFNVNAGEFSLLFEDTQDLINDPYSQRTDGKLENATIKFAANTTYRPKVLQTSSNTIKIASLDHSKTTLDDKTSTTFLPFEISRLNIGTYEGLVNYSKFEGWDKELARIDLSGSTTIIEIKRNLAGFQGLPAAADIYRQQTDLTFEEREALDNIYLTGYVPQSIKNLFHAIGGDDYLNYEQIHRGTIRQFSRQISSRVHNRNKDIDAETTSDGFTTNHWWFNISHSQIKKEQDSNSLGYDYNPTSVALGFDKDLILDTFNLGFALSHSYGDAKTKSHNVNYSKNSIRNYLLALYAKYKNNRHYISSAIGGGISSNKTNFINGSTDTTGKYKTKTFFSNIETGYDISGCYRFTIQPYIGIEHSLIKSDSYRERGQNARNIETKSWNIIEVPIGLRLSQDFFSEEHLFTPSFDIAYARNIGDTGTNADINFVSTPSSKWNISSGSDQRDSLRANLNFKINSLNQPFALNFGYSLDYRSDYSDNQIYGTIRFDF